MVVTFAEISFFLAISLLDFFSRSLYELPCHRSENRHAMSRIIWLWQPSSAYHKALHSAVYSSHISAYGELVRVPYALQTGFVMRRPCRVQKLRKTELEGPRWQSMTRSRARKSSCLLSRTTARRTHWYRRRQDPSTSWNYIHGIRHYSSTLTSTRTVRIDSTSRRKKKSFDHEH